MKKLKVTLASLVAMLSLSSSAEEDRRPAAVAPVPDAPVSDIEKDKKGGGKGDAAADAEAERARKEREARVPTVVEEKAREKVEVAAEPTLDYEGFRTQQEQKVQGKRKELLDTLEEILKGEVSAAERPDLLFQKAELFLEEAQFWFFEANRMDDALAAALSKGDDKKMMEVTEKKDKLLAKQKEWGDGAIKLFEEIDKKYKKFERLPDVLYMMGQAYWDRQDYKQALVVYRKLIKDHPKNQYISDAWLAFGEFYFLVAPDEERDVQKALDAYIKAAANQESAVFGYATYKQGWCYYNLSRHDKAAEKFKEVVLYSQVNGSILGERRIGLAKEARKDYVLAYAQYGSGANAPNEFKAIADGPEHRAMLERLADIYYGDGKDRDAIVTFQTLMKMTPEATKNPIFQGKIVKLASRIGEKKQVVGQARKLVDEFKRVRGVLANTKTGDPKKEIIVNDLQNADDISDNTLRYLATTWHNEAKKTLDTSTFEYSYELYGDYLELFPERKESYEMRFFYAELLYKLEKFEIAGEQYVKVYLQDTKGKWAEPAAEEAVRSYDEVIKDYDRVEKKKAPVAVNPANALKEKPIPELKKKYIAACNNYVTNYPKGKLGVEVAYKVARTLYDYNYFKESTPRFIEFTELHSEHARAEQAANLVLDTFNIQEDWSGLNGAARTFSRNNGLMKSKDFRETLLKVLEESTFKLISDFEKKRQWEEAAKRYLSFSEEFPKSALADKGLANAAAMFTRAGQLDRAIKVRQKLVNTYKDSPLVPDQIFAIAASYEQIVSYKDAAAWLERFVEQYPKDSRAKDALYNASIYRHGTNDTKKAVEDRELYLKTFKDAADIEDVHYSIATAWEEASKPKDAIKAYGDFADAWRKKDPVKALNAQYKAYRLLEKTKPSKRDLDKGYAELVDQVRSFQRSGKPVDDVGDPLALVAFRNADVVLEKYKDVKITKADKPAEFKKTLQQKRDAKDAVDKAYTEVVKLKSPEWAVASLFRIGEAGANLVKVIKDVPAPKGLTEEQGQLFKDKLEEMTLPIEEQAAQTMVLCLDKSAELAVFNEWTRRCLGYLEENRPNQYPKNSSDQRTPLVVTRERPEQGRGMILDLPKPGEKPKVEPGSEPPPPPKSDGPATKDDTVELSASDLAGGG
ncbi:MAG: tetratricopeptide repeat protein [Deltaproteobacteria bacterium]|nr:tetratricopeptide repeat protein [Deltaproteobacteria bacterium]